MKWKRLFLRGAVDDGVLLLRYVGVALVFVPIVIYATMRSKGKP